MRVGILLLTQDNQYVDAAGNLPQRPKFDKQLLKRLIKGQKVAASFNTINLMPEWNIQWAVNDYDVNLGISTMSLYPPHLLIIVRSTETFTGGKVFRFDRWDLMVEQPNLELWILK